MAVLAPMPNASVSTAIAVNPGDLRILLRPYRASSTKFSSHRRPHAPLVASFTNSIFPNSRRAACSASSAVSPRSKCPRLAISRWLRTSSSSSFSRFHPPKSPLSQLIAAPLLLPISYFQFLFVPQRHHRIDLHRPPSWNPARQQRDEHEKERDAGIGQRVRRAN